MSWPKLRANQTATCNVDQRSFKAYLSRWMAATTKVAPFTYDLIAPKLQASALAAAQQCNGADNACGLRWTMGTQYDGSAGVGEQMSALEIFQSNLIDQVVGPVTNKTGGTSQGDSSAGTATPIRSCWMCIQQNHCCWSCWCWYPYRHYHYLHSRWRLVDGIVRVPIGNNYRQWGNRLIPSSFEARTSPWVYIILIRLRAAHWFPELSLHAQSGCPRSWTHLGVCMLIGSC
jgi:Glycosyl hydrolase family 76.